MAGGTPLFLRTVRKRKKGIELNAPRDAGSAKKMILNELDRSRGRYGYKSLKRSDLGTARANGNGRGPRGARRYWRTGVRGQSSQT